MNDEAAAPPDAFAECFDGAAMQLSDHRRASEPDAEAALAHGRENPEAA
jgi:hypothetical protein